MKKNSKDVVTYTEDEIRSDPYGFTLKEITEVLGEQEAQKLFNELYKKKPISKYQTVKIKEIQQGGDTSKYAFELTDGYCIETVCIKRKTGTTVCVSNIPVLKNISFFVDSGDFLVLLGPSGSGKSTILSIIAGFEPQNSGDVFIDGNNCNKKPCQDRDVAMVFQNYALYPCMNVYNNIAFPLINRHEKKEIVNQKVRTIAKTLHIEDILKKKVDKISGGQKQRVAIGRALVREPTLLLLDEPLSNLDAVLRTQMRKELFNLHSQFRITMVYVTHDQSEALSLATKIIVLDGGEIQQIGTPQEIYDFPQNEFVATFIGSPQMNFFKEYNVFTVNERVY